ncbi:Albumin-2 [Ceratobasidium theobromae]|uniref:Albumin-2 n=1 Tax=Ceratobasidium theobromae TaxID=1582974 RepID=A0A5N5QA82_9AGAM|nr:Albumin-2 [Ceratobasidium theobromae]
MVGRGALNIAGHNQTYFFHGDKYVKINWSPDQGGDSIQYGPTEFAKEWPTLKEAGFAQVDAILPIPGHQYRAYFFCGSHYARIDFTPSEPGDKILGGVHPIHGYWRSLEKAGFTTVDGAIQVPGHSDQAYFFSGEHYVRVRWTEGVVNDELLEGPTPIKYLWPQTGFDQIDTIIPWPGQHDGAYIFSGDYYVRVRSIDSSGDHTPPHQNAVVSRSWSSLHKAGFY